jgi:Kef-type K+ transport system membrane component KefB
MMNKSYQKLKTPPAQRSFFKHGLLYTLMIGLCLLLIGGVLSLGPLLEQGHLVSAAARSDAAPLFSLAEQLQHPLALFFLQVLVVVTASRVVGLLALRLGQPAVMGEILAGILLGPSLLGLIWPEFNQFLFPVASLKPLQLISQLGLIFFMFIIGLELDQELLKDKTQAAVLISHVSIVFPFLLGVGLAAVLYRSFSPTQVSFVSFALFMGISMSITAFPVLARIIQERRLQKTSYGSLALTCAAVDDVSAWCLLALVVAIASARSPLAAGLTLALSAVYILTMLYLIKPWMAHRISKQIDAKGEVPHAVVAGVLIFVLFSALTTELIGIHALFGAFLAGAIMPNDKAFRHVFIERIEYLSVLVLLPLFFTFTGLRTQIGLLNQPALWGTALIIVLVAMAGKLGGAVFAARLSKQGWAESLRIGVLMNTRGLMELIVLNIGYDLGILSAEMFTMLVLMALVTTFMTGPALSLIDRVFKDAQDHPLRVPQS